MLKIKIIAVGKIKEKYFLDAFNEYIKRAGRYANLQTIEIKEEKITKANLSEIESALEIESRDILKNASGFICALDINGKKNSSHDFAQLFENAALNYSEISFIIGSSHGLSGAVKERAHSLISFSDMTFAHTLFRVMLSEQIYRALSILNNGSYHK